MQICTWFYHQKKKTLVLIYVGKTRVIENLFLYQCLRHCLLKKMGIGSTYLSSVVINHLETNFKSNMLNFKVLMGSLCPLWQGYNYCSISHEQFTPKLHIITMKFKLNDMNMSLTPNHTSYACLQRTCPKTICIAHKTRENTRFSNSQ
jgi:hypothetical protein